ncbi:class I SAM-dependent methyltransferase [Streptomyces sp. NPDC006703]|uniref:class I SAM-dependent methyltransferase n=1 Tax=Streptomyces sp. NPDC006703 TaxID=3364759 RepID=UPI0036C49184
MNVARLRDARHWDLAYRHGSTFRRVTSVERMMFATYVRVIKGETRVVDIGCGTGEWTRGLARMGATVRGYDISRVAISKARTLSSSQAGFASYDVWDVNSDDVPLYLAPQSIDVLTCRLSLSYLDIPRFTANARRWLKPQGVLHVMTQVDNRPADAEPHRGWHPEPHRGLNADQIAYLCEQWRDAVHYKLDLAGQTICLVLQHPK